MKETFRQSMGWLHTWTGLLVGWLLYFMFLTGTTGYFNAEIDHWMRPEQLLPAHDAAPSQALDLALKRLTLEAPEAETWSIDLPNTGRGDPSLRIFHRTRPAKDGKPENINEVLDTNTGLPVELKPRKTGGGWTLYRMHYRLHYLSGNTPLWIVGGAGMCMLVALTTGLIIHRRLLRDMFTFRKGTKARTWLDAHTVSSVIALPFHVMIIYSGLLWFMFTYMPYIVPATYGETEADRKAFFESAFPRREGTQRSGTPAPLTPLPPLLDQAESVWGRDQVRFIRVEHVGDANARVIIGRRSTRRLMGADELVFFGV
ncbi:MAG: PepSY domain-containing protein, partial [Verrucomicrobiae bacterium]|nr:PepSY domain-containing protein [Verrucomicrobiae bacterium]